MPAKQAARWPKQPCLRRPEFSTGEPRNTRGGTCSFTPRTGKPHGSWTHISEIEYRGTALTQATHQRPASLSAGKTEISAALVQPLVPSTFKAVKRKNRALTGANGTS